MRTEYRLVTQHLAGDPKTLSMRLVSFKPDGSVHTIGPKPVSLVGTTMDDLSAVVSGFFVACKHPVLDWDTGEEAGVHAGSV